jgi:hypothetical protein
MTTNIFPRALFCSLKIKKKQNVINVYNFVTYFLHLKYMSVL